METLEIPVTEDLTETAHWSDDPPPNIEDEEFDLLAFDLWHRGSLPDPEVEEWPETEDVVANRASCL